MALKSVYIKENCDHETFLVTQQVNKRIVMHLEYELRLHYNVTYSLHRLSSQTVKMIN